MSKEKMIETVKKLVDDHSGGMKFTELITELTKIAVQEGWIIGDSDDILSEIIQCPDLRVLRYFCYKWNREKCFIYTE